MALWRENMALSKEERERREQEREKSIVREGSFFDMPAFRPTRGYRLDVIESASNRRAAKVYICEENLE